MAVPKNTKSIFKLNVYRGKEIVKTLTCDSYDLSLGTLEDFIALIGEGKTDIEVMKELTFIRPLLQEIFPDATNEDLRRVHAKDVFKLLQKVMQYASAAMWGDEPKN